MRRVPGTQASCIRRLGSRYLIEPVASTARGDWAGIAPPSPAHRFPRPSRLDILTPRNVIAFGAAAGAAFAVLPRGGVGQALVFLATNGGALALLVRAMRARPTPALPWRVLVAGSALYFATVVPWYLLPVAFRRPVGYPSVLDAAFLLAYLLFALFLALLLRAHAGRDPDALDAVIVTVGASVLFWEFFLVPALAPADGSLLGRVTAVAYCVALLVLLALVVRLARVPVVRTGPYRLLGAWITAELIGDVWYSVSSARGSFAYGHPWFLAWIAAYTALAAAAVHPRIFALGAPAPTVRRYGTAWHRLVVLGVAGAAPLVGIGYRVVQGSTDNVLGLVFIAAGLTALVLVRLSRLTVDLDGQRRTQERLESLTRQLERQAFSDPVSGLGSRALFNDRLELALATRRVAGRTPGLLLLDLDSFKSVNDGFGHEIGDRVLAQVGGRLRLCTRGGDTVARLGGDEFAIVLAHSDLAEAVRVAERVQAALAEPITIEGHDFPASASVGVVVAEPGDEPSTLLRHADIAMYAAKANGRGSFQVYNPHLHEAVLERHRLESDLRGAPARGELVLHYQPILHLATGAVRAVEALVRWQHPVRGLVPPDDFIGVAEASGTIREIGAWVLEHACTQLGKWDDADLPALQLSVNLSPLELQDTDLVDRVGGILARTRTNSDRVTFEVTETALMRDPDQVIETLHRLKRRGITFALDDFGTGYSSLSYLRRMPIDVIKIDRSFIAGIARDRDERALTAAIIRLSNSLGKRTVAEGIELGAQMAHLRALDCEFGQGYLFSRPLPAPELERFVRVGLRSRPSGAAVRGGRAGGSSSLAAQDCEQLARRDDVGAP